MTQLQHVYVTAHGQFTTGSWVGESAQFGIRLAIVEDAAAPAPGTTFPIPLHGDVVVDQGQQSGTNGTLTKTWTARRGPVGSVENADAGFQIDLAEDIRTFLEAMKQYQHTSFRWTHVKIAPVSAVGKTIGTASVYQFTAPIVGSGVSMLPPQNAIAITMRANILGRRGRGRCYMPALSTTVIAQDGTLASTATTNYRAAFVTLLNALQDLPGLEEWSPLVMVTSPGLPTGVRPSQVRTGQRCDTIRSRRQQVPETYTSTDL